jgi:signal-transduction protein with cAMP-binding, CBS, and nucleotidyltransferase domain
VRRITQHVIVYLAYWSAYASGENRMTIRAAELKSQNLFASLSGEELQNICDHGVVQEYHKGQFLIKEASLNHFLFFIVKGSVHIKSYGVKVATLSNGDLIGEVSAAGLGSTIADVIAAGSVTAYRFPIEIIHETLKHNETFAAYLHDKAMARVLR